jgi:hypothetical protein
MAKNFMLSADKRGNKLLGLIQILSIVLVITLAISCSKQASAQENSGGVSKKVEREAKALIEKFFEYSYEGIHDNPKFDKITTAQGRKYAELIGTGLRYYNKKPGDVKILEIGAPDENGTLSCLVDLEFEKESLEVIKTDDGLKINGVKAVH